MYDSFIKELRNYINENADLLFDDKEFKSLTKVGFIVFVLISYQFLDILLKSLNELKEK